MTEKKTRQHNDLRPQAQRAEEHGNIKSVQLTGRNMPHPDLPQGSEPEVNARKG